MITAQMLHQLAWNYGNAFNTLGLVSYLFVPSEKKNFYSFPVMKGAFFVNATPQGLLSSIFNSVVLLKMTY